MLLRIYNRVIAVISLLVFSKAHESALDNPYCPHKPSISIRDIQNKRSKNIARAKYI